MGAGVDLTHAALAEPPLSPLPSLSGSQEGPGREKGSPVGGWARSPARQCPHDGTRCWPSRAPPLGGADSASGDPTLYPCHLSPSRGAHQHRDPSGPAQAVCEGVPSSNPLLETHDLAVHQGLCLKDPGNGGWEAVREADHKSKYQCPLTALS